MSWQWLQDYVRRPKDAQDAQRILDRYRLGKKAYGAIRGVRIITSSDSCPTCRKYAKVIFGLDEAPPIPISGCTNPKGCRCTYTAAMDYDGPDSGT